jgi:hypothetical protein
LFLLEILTYSVALVRKRIIPTERPPLVGEVSAFLKVFSGQYVSASLHSLLCNILSMTNYCEFENKSQDFDDFTCFQHI